MKILLVDNDPTLLKFLAPRLEQKGFEVTTAADGLRALDILADMTPDFILVDYIMPNVDGRAFCTIIREIPRLGGCFVAVLSAVAAESELDIQRLGADACIAKGPFDKMLGHILDLLSAPEKAAQQCAKGEVIGLSDVVPRGITLELLAAKRHFETILNRMSEGILEINGEGRIVYANPSAIAFCGLEEKNLLGARFVDIFGPDTPDAVVQATTRLGVEGGGGEIGADIRVKERLFAMKMLLLDQASGALVILTDISAQHRAQKALAESEEKYRNVVENVGVGILVAQGGRVVFANQAIAGFLGKRAEELTDVQDPFDFIHPEDRPLVLDRHIRRLKGEMVASRYSFRVFDAEGKTRWVDVSCVLITWNGTPATLNFFSDVTDHLASQKALADSESRYRHLVNVAPAGIYEIDYRIPKLISVNDLLCEYSGYSREELLSMNPLDLLTEESRRHYQERLEKIAESQLVTDTVEYEGVRKNGEQVLFQLSANYTYEDGKIVGSTCVVQDVTQLRKVEEEKQRLEAQLQQAQKLEALGTLAGGIAHDFNNLLMGIQARISLMLLQIDPSHPHHRHLKAVEQYIESGAGLTKQVLGFARRGKYHVQATDMNDIVRQSAEMFGRTKKEITIHQKLADNIPAVMIDRSQIQQVLLNLYVNAWQAMDGIGDLTLTTGETTVRQGTADAGDLDPGRYVEIRVADNGPGMNPSIQERIFDPFFTTKARGRGTGLGLASAYGIIRSHGGSITVDSEAGRGATFIIRLPATNEQIQGVEMAGEETASGSETILLVDDEQFVLESAQDLLKELGYRVITAENGPKAIEIFEKQHEDIDLVVLDMIMPGVTGGQVFDRLRKIDPEARILLSSGYSINGEATEILDRGCDGFIQKPFRIEVFSRKIREILG
ncbi:MAG: PAS domain S-box protein [Desulfobacterales bacterium]|jgi:PAS domain S-box-containing protein